MLTHDPELRILDHVGIHSLATVSVVVRDQLERNRIDHAVEAHVDVLANGFTIDAEDSVGHVVGDSVDIVRKTVIEYVGPTETHVRFLETFIEVGKSNHVIYSQLELDQMLRYC